MYASNYRSPVFATALVLVLQACSSSTTKDATGAKAASNLDSGRCPSSIVNDQGKDSSGRKRYKGSVSATQLRELRAREISNCTGLVREGSTEALATLVSYYDATGQKANLVGLLETYIASGTDRKKLADAGAYLYRAYSTGTPGVSRDSAKAFKYLGVAVNNGNRSLELAYAESLADRGLHKDSLRYFQSIAVNGRSQEERCQAKLNLGQLYFGGSPTHENWNIGYYYWQEGLSLAKNPKWGSCAKDNFTSPNYSHETSRKKFVDPRIALMSSAQRQVIDEARRDPNKGYDFVAALNFQKPTGAPAVAKTTQRTQVNTYLPGWPAWAPATAQICNNLKYSGRELRWNEVFDVNSQAIWTVDSRNGKNQSQGSAVAVSPSELVTNCHLIENPKQITLRRVGWTLPARLKAADRQGDRCILEVGHNLPTYVRRGRSHAAVQIGEDVAAIGNPKGLETSLSRGIVGQKRSRGGLKLIQTDAAISSGSSGGGLFDRAGYLVGITTFTIAEGQSLNFAIAIDEFCR
ncbi:MAG: trypsin-like peptidase domain-containing protein [Halioglobus sp.]